MIAVGFLHRLKADCDRTYSNGDEPPFFCLTEQNTWNQMGLAPVESSKWEQGSPRTRRKVMFSLKRLRVRPPLLQSKAVSRNLLGVFLLTTLGFADPAHSVAVAKEKEPPEYQAWLCLDHAVYTIGDPIDLTFWVRKAKYPITPAFEVLDSKGKKLAEKPVQGRTFATIKDRSGKKDETDGSIPAALDSGASKILDPYVESIVDLRIWYDFDQPGTYSVRFVGQQRKADEKSRLVASNTVTLLLRAKQNASDRIIPLKSIWAYEMPGTRVLSERGDENAVLNEIRRSLKFDPKKHPTAPEGFAVRGEGLEALREAQAVLVKGEKPRTSFKDDDSISLVFFSYEFGAYVHVTSVEQRESVVQVAYRFVQHQTRELTEHIALIPLGRMKEGTIRVVINHQIDTSAPDRLDRDDEIPRTVCRSFDIKVTK